MKVITGNYLVIRDWINIMAEMIEPQGLPCKTLRDNPFKSHKINSRD